MKPTSRKTAAQVRVTRLTPGGVEEFHVWAAAGVGTSAAGCALGLYRAIARKLRSPKTLRIVSERVFGRLSEKPAVLKAHAAEFLAAGLDPHTPVTYLECAPSSGTSPAGVEMTLVRAAPGVSVMPLFDGKRPCGFKVTRGRITRVYLSAMEGVGGKAPGSRASQARRMFRRAAAVLANAGLSYRNVVCTRIYLKQLLDWYGEFNAERNRFFRASGIGGPTFPVPTSTGIQGRVSAACECVMDVLAVSKGRVRQSPFVRLSNPLQNEATDYGSAFARGGRVDLPGARFVFLAGTASIDEAGRSVHVGDAVRQTRRTMENFEAIARAGGAKIADLYEAVWYCKRPSDAAVVRREMRRRGWPRRPFIVVVADVCRADLLVEIDGAAAVTRRR